MRLRRLTELEIQLLGQKLALADLVADDNQFALTVSGVIGDCFHPEDFGRVIEEAFLIAEYRLENLASARDQARTSEVLFQRVINKQRSDGT